MNEKNFYTRFILGVRVDTTDMDTALNKVEDFVIRPYSQHPRQVFFTNVHSIEMAAHDSELQQCINNADMVLPDGSGLDIAGRVLDKPIIENLNGTDFTPRVLEKAVEKNWSIYLLGAEPGVAEQCTSKLKNILPDLKIAGYHHGYFSDDEEESIIEDINKSETDIVLVAMGTPLQEKWISGHAHDLNTKICFAVGGLFDFIAGQVPRAPLWMRDMGIEWVHRFFQNPKDKWERIFKEIPVFLFKVILRNFEPQKIRPHFIR